MNCHFLWSGEIQSDVHPADFQQPADHEALLAYLQLVSTTLQKPVLLAPEGAPEVVLLEVTGTEVRYYF
ncbi:hypothetical protein GCM10023186_29120 [Hymenobacter koreensis]|uniref:Uncharacterized protein n=1 Tax=Hymenobacter koreensis TaxID=1084523 RepID=A0ABP8J5S0_9BACT